MSDTSSTPYGDIKFTVTADTSEAAILRNSLSQVAQDINNTVATINKLSSTQQMLQNITKGTGNTTKTFTGLIAANTKAHVLSNKIISEAVKQNAALDQVITRLGTSSPKATAALQSQAAATAKLASSATSLNKALQATSIQQWANRSKGSLTQMNMSILRATAQTFAFTRALRTAFFSFADLEQESARVTKLMVDNFGSGEEAIKLAAEQTAVLGKELDKITRKFGTSRVLVQALAGDFAELGIGDTQALADLVELTTTVEKLGNVDIEQSQKFVESMLQNILRVKREQSQALGQQLDLTDPKQFAVIIQELRGQLAEFNLVENKTSLSLKDLADAFPEVSAAATTFGLSMTESAALLAPMVASGFQVGASANSIKVSLQRMVAMTKQNSQIIGELNKALGPDFDYAAGVSIENIQKLTDGFNTLLSIKGEQGTLELFSRLFGVRQGPRMETSIRQLAVYQKQLSEANSVERKISSVLESNINARLKAAGYAENEMFSLNKMIDISDLHRKATESVNGQYTKRANIIRIGQEQAFNQLNKLFGTSGDKSQDFLSKINTEAGRILMSTAFRIEDVAQKQLETELKIGLDTTITKFRILKEEVLAIGRVIVSAFRPLIEFFTPILQAIRDFIERLSPAGKKMLSFAVIFAGLLPTIKLLSVSFRWFFAGAVSSLAKLATSFGKTGAKIVDVTDLIMRGGKALKGWQNATSLPGGQQVLLSGRKRGAVTDVSGLNPQLQKIMQQGSGPGSGSLKSIIRRAAGLPAGGLEIEALGGAIDALDGTADAAATTAKAVGDSVKEALAVGFKGAVFTSNRFMGNTFTGGPGGSGTGRAGTPRGPRTPRSPRTPADTRPTYGPPAPSPVYGPEVPPPDTRPTYGPSLPPPVTGTSGIPAGGFKVPTTPVLPTIPGPEPVKKTVAEVKKRVTKGVKDAVKKGTDVVADVTAGVGAVVADTAAAVTSVSSDAAATITDGIDDAKKAASKGGRVAKTVTLHTRDIVKALDDVHVSLPNDYMFLRTWDKEWEVSETKMKTLLKDTQQMAVEVRDVKAPKAVNEALSFAQDPKNKGLGRNISKELKARANQVIELENKLERALELQGSKDTAVAKKAANEVIALREKIDIAQKQLFDQAMTEQMRVTGPFGELIADKGQGSKRGRRFKFRPGRAGGVDKDGKKIAARTLNQKSHAVEVYEDIFKKRVEAGGLTATESGNLLNAVGGAGADPNAARSAAAKAAKASKAAENAAKEAAADAARKLNADFETARAKLLKGVFNGLDAEIYGLQEVVNYSSDASIRYGELEKHVDKLSKEIKVFEDALARTDIPQGTRASLTKNLDVARKTHAKALADLTAKKMQFEAEQVLKGSPRTLVTAPSALGKAFTDIQLDKDMGAAAVSGLGGGDTANKNYYKILTERFAKTVPSAAVPKADIQMKALYEMLLQSKIDDINEALDSGVDKALTEKVNQRLMQTTPQGKKISPQRIAALRRQVISSIARDQIRDQQSLAEFNPLDQRYNPEAEQKLVSRKGLMSRVKSRMIQDVLDKDHMTFGQTLPQVEKSLPKLDQTKRTRISKMLEEARNRVALVDAEMAAIAKDGSKAATDSRNKIRKAFLKARAALLEKYGSIEAAEAAMTAQAKLDAGVIKGATAATSAATPTAASVARPVVSASGAGTVRLPGGVSRVFFADAVKAASASVTGVSKTVADEIARLLDDVLVKAIPAGFDPAKVNVMRKVIQKVLMTVPITGNAEYADIAKLVMSQSLLLNDELTKVIQQVFSFGQLQTLGDDLTKALSTGTIAMREVDGGVFMKAKGAIMGTFRKIASAKTATAAGVVASLSDFRIFVEAAVLDAVTAAGAAVEGVKSPIAEAFRAGTYKEEMLDEYLGGIGAEKVARSDKAVESAEKGARKRGPSKSKEQRALERRKKRVVERLVKERPDLDVETAGRMFDEAAGKGEKALEELAPKGKRGVKAAVAEKVTEAAEAAKDAAAEVTEEVGKSISDAAEKVSDATTGAIKEATEGVTAAAATSGGTAATTVGTAATSAAIPDALDARTTKLSDLKSFLKGDKDKSELYKKIKSLREIDEVLNKEISDAAKRLTQVQEGLKTDTSERGQKFWKKELEKVEKEFNKKTKALISNNKELDKTQRKLNSMLKSARDAAAKAEKAASASTAAPSAAPAGAAPAAAATTGAAGAGATGAAPRAPRVAVPTAAPATAVVSSAIVEKLDEVIVEFDRSLANFFKGPNFFQGPNYFAGPLQVMPNAKFKDYKKKFSDMTEGERAARISHHTRRAEEAKRRIDARAAARAAGADPAAAATTAASAATGAAVAKAGLLKTALSGVASIVGKGLAAAGKVGGAALSGAFKIVGKSTSEFFKMSIAFLDMYVTALGGAGASSRMAGMAALVGSKAIAGLGRAAAIADKMIKGLAGAFFSLGKAIGATTATELSTFFASLQKSKIIKAWSFLLFTGIKPLIKGFVALGIAAGRALLTMKFSGLVASFQQLYQTVLRTALSFTALAIKINAALLMIAPVVVLLFAIISKVKRGIQGLSPASENFKAAWVAIKDAIYALAAPLENMIGAFAGISKQNDSVKRTAGLIWVISKAIRAAAEAFQRFATGVGAKYMQSTVVPILTRIINRFILLGRAIGAAFGGKSAEAGKNFKGLLLSLLYEAIAFVGKFVSIIAAGLEMFAPTLAKIIDAIVAATITAFIKIMSFAKEVMMLLGSIITVVGAISGQLPIALGGAAIVAGGVGITALEGRIEKFAADVKSGQKGVGESIANGITSGAKGAARGLDKFKNFVGKKYGETIGRGINSALSATLIKEMPKDVKNAIMRSAQDANAGGESLGEQIAKGIKNGLRDLKSEFTDNFFGRADEQVDKFVEKLKEGLNEQKDKALEAFDNQVEAIEALAEAEERLTAKIEYEEKRREMIRERALDRENYLRERKVAAYEGRSEDVRSLDLAFQKSSKEKDKELKDFDLDRVKTLQGQNREDAIKIINKEKEALIKEYDKMFKDFDQRIEKIKIRGFSNEEEFKQMFTNIQTVASGFSDDLATSFTNAMTRLPSLIRDGTDPAIGMFSTSMSQLVDEAKRSFGAGVAGPNAESILGAAYYLVKGMPDAFKQAFSAGIIPQFVTPFSTAVKTELDRTVPKDLWIEAAGLAIIEMVNEMKRKLVALKGTLYDEFKKLFADLPVEDLKRIFGEMFPDLDLEKLKEYFANLFPSAEELKKKIVIIETTRSQEDSGGGQSDKPKTPSLTPSEINPPQDSRDNLVRVGYGLQAKPVDPRDLEPKEDPKQGFFGKLRDIIVSIADYLGPLKTAILGAVGVVAGMGAAIPIWTAIKGLAIGIGSTIGLLPLIIGTIIGTLIYLYARFKSVRDVVNGIVIAIWDGLVAAFNFLKDLSVATFEGIKIGIPKIWEGLKDFSKPFIIAFDWIVEWGGRLWNILKEIGVKLGPPTWNVIWETLKFAFDISIALIKEFVRIFKSIWGAIKAVIGPPLNFIWETVKIVVGGISLLLVKLVEWTIIAFEKLMPVVMPVFQKIFDGISFIFDLFNQYVTPVLVKIIEVIGRALSAPFDGIRIIFDFAYKSIGDFFGGIVRLFQNIAPFLGPAIWSPIKALAPIVKGIFEFIIDAAKKVYDFVSPIFLAIVSVIVSVFSSVVNVISSIIGKVVDVASGIAVAIFSVLNAIWNNPVVKWIRDFLFRVLMLGIFIIAKLLETFAKTIYNAFKTVFDILKTIAIFLYDTFKPGFELIWNFAMIVKDLLVGAFKTAWSVVQPILQGIWDLIKWIYEEFGIIGLILTPFIAAFEFLRKVVMLLFEFMKAAFETIFNLVKKIMGPIIDLAKLIWEGLGWVWGRIKGYAELWWDTVSAIFEYFVDILKLVGQVVWDALGKVWDLVGAALKKYWEFLKLFWGTVWDILKLAGNAIWDAFGWVWDIVGIALKKYWELLKKFWGGVWEIFKAVGGVIWDALGFIWDQLSYAVRKYWAAVRKIFVTFIDILKTVAKAIWEGLGWIWNNIGPAIQKFFEIAKMVFNKIVEFAVSVGNAIWDGLGWVWGIIGTAAKKFWEGVKYVAEAVWELIKKVGQGIWDALGWVWEALKNPIKTFWDAITEGWIIIEPVFTKIWSWLWDKIKVGWEFIKDILTEYWGVFQEFWGWIEPVLSKLWSWLWDGIVWVWERLKEALNGYWEIFKTIWGWIEPVLSQLWEWLWNGIKWAWDQITEAIDFYWELFKKVWNWIEPVLSKLWEWLWNGIKWAWDKITDAIGFLWEKFKQFWSWAGPILLEFASWIWDKIKAGWEKVTEAIQFVWNKIKEFWSWAGPVLKEFAHWVWDKIAAGLDFIKNLWGSIKSAFSTFYDFVVPKIQKIGDFIRDALGGAIDFVIGLVGKIPNLFASAINLVIKGINKITGYTFTMPEWLKYVGLGSIAGKTYSFRDVIPEIKEIEVGKEVTALQRQEDYMKAVAQWNATSAKLAEAMRSGALTDDQVAKAQATLAQQKIALQSKAAGLVQPDGKYNGGKIRSYMKGGMTYAFGGVTPGFSQQAVPAILHGGEYIINHKAVQRIGTDALNALNNLRLSKPRYPRMPAIPGISMPNVRIDNSTQVPSSSSTSNVNIYVDNFIGEPEWFNSMMKEYNMKVVPRNQKAAGLENRVIRTYNGINRGM